MSNLAAQITAAGLTLPRYPSGRLFGRRALTAWLNEQGIPCSIHDVRTMTAAGERYWVSPETVSEDVLADVEDGVHDPRAQVDESMADTDEDGMEIIAMTETIINAHGEKSWIRKKPKTAGVPVLPEATLNAFREKLLAANFVRDTHRSKPVKGGPVAFVVSQSDAQLGKTGTSEAVENWLDGVDMAVEEAARLIDNGVNIVQVISNNGGDPIENLFNYSNQSWILELDLISQIDLAIDTRLSALMRLAGLGLPIRDWTYESNHGEASRAGGAKAIATTTADSHDILISRQVQKLAALTPALADVTFVYPEVDERGQREWFVYEDVCGVGVYASHGHREHGKGAFQEAKVLNGVQRVGWAYRTRMHAMRVAFEAHYHHYYLQQNADLSVFGVPALEAFKSSGYLLSGGIYSHPGVLSTLVGDGAGVQGWARPMVHTPVRLPISA